MNPGFFGHQQHRNGYPRTPDSALANKGSGLVKGPARGKRQSSWDSPSPSGVAVGSQGLSPQQLRQQASLTVQQGDCAGAIALLSSLVSQNLASAIDYNNRGLMYFQNGEYEKAMADYNQAIALDSQLSQAYNNRGNCYAALGLRVEATLDYDMAIDLNPFNVRALLNQGITLREMEIYELAIENFEMALGLGQIEGHIFAERGRTYHVMGEWNAAIADYRRALEFLPESGLASPEASMRLRSLVKSWIHELIGSGDNSLNL
jgi:tetratricopeptide (TPR) repeat protein